MGINYCNVISHENSQDLDQDCECRAFVSYTNYRKHNEIKMFVEAIIGP